MKEIYELLRTNVNVQRGDLELIQRDFGKVELASGLDISVWLPNPMLVVRLNPFPTRYYTQEHVAAMTPSLYFNHKWRQTLNPKAFWIKAFCTIAPCVSGWVCEGNAGGPINNALDHGRLYDAIDMVLATIQTSTAKGGFFGDSEGLWTSIVRSNIEELNRVIANRKSTAKD